MTKKQFLDGLYHSLLTEMNKEEIYGHIQYYEDYIENEKMKGRSEEEVVNQLGSPRLIAKTILASSGSSNYTYESADDKVQNSDNGTEKKWGLGFLKWIKRIILTVIILFLVIQLIRFAFWIFIRLILPIALIVFAFKLIRDLFK